MHHAWRKVSSVILIAAVTLGWASSSVAATGPGDADADWPSWVDEEEALRQRIATVNEGDLDFITGQPQDVVHHHRSRILISDTSLLDGWVLLEQCHFNLDRVAAAQIVFNPQRSRGLEVVSFRNIDHAFAEANSIQLQGVRDDSEICLRAESRALHSDDAAVFELQNGPFMRRFLDGYYPLRLSLRIDHPRSLVLADFSPETQPGFAVTQADDHIAIEALFEGQLRTRFRFLAD
ncbi:MAG: alpha/beta hydrolase [Sedimenticolaceae bacterium]